MAKGFYVRRGDLMLHVLESAELTPAQKNIVLLMLMKHLNRDTEKAFMSAKRLADPLGAAVETVRRALKKACSLGFLLSTPRTGRTTLYGMGPAYRYAPRPRPEGPGLPAAESRAPRPQRHPNLKTEPEYEPFSEPRRKRAQGGLRKLTAIKSLEQLCKEAGLEGSEDDDDEAGE